MPARSSEGSPGKRQRTWSLLSTVIVAGASYYGAHLGATRGASDAAATFAPTGTAPSGKPYATAYAGEPATSNRCASTISGITRALSVQAIGVTPDGDVARFNDRWFADVRVSCPPRPAMWVSWERAEFPPEAMVMAADYGVVLFGGKLEDLAGAIGDACRQAQAEKTDEGPTRHGYIEMRLYRVSCDRPERRDGYVLSINSPI